MKYYTLSTYGGNDPITTEWSTMDAAERHAEMVWADRNPKVQFNPVRKVEIVNTLGVKLKEFTA